MFISHHAFFSWRLKHGMPGGSNFFYSRALVMPWAAVLVFPNIQQLRRHELPSHMCLDIHSPWGEQCRTDVSPRWQGSMRWKFVHWVT